MGIDPRRYLIRRQILGIGVYYRRPEPFPTQVGRHDRHQEGWLDPGHVIPKFLKNLAAIAGVDQYYIGMGLGH